MWRIDELKIRELIELIDNAEIGLPQFQRPSVWGKSNWVPFLATILLGRPTGTLLLHESKGEPALAPRAIDTAPDVVEANLHLFLLDGQQRTTTLYKAARTHFGSGRTVRKIVVYVKDAFERGEFLEEDVRVQKANEVLGFADMARAGKIEFSTLLSAQELAGWQQEFVRNHTSDDAAVFIAKTEEVIPGLLDVSSYRFPILRIKDDTPLDVVADIFEGMNRRGQALNKFDLMVARLYRPIDGGGRYDLRESWMGYLENSPNLRRLGIDGDDGMLPLQLIAKQVSRRDSSGKVKGLNSKDVLELPPDQIIGSKKSTVPHVHLESAVKALEDAARFLVDYCGVAAPSLLPQQAMLLPLADRYIQKSGPGLDENQLKRWFFSVGLAIDYYGSVNSYADRDCNRLRRWADPEDGAVPESVAALNRSMIEGLELSQAFTREGNILGRTVMALLVSNGALDWKEGQIRVSNSEDIDYHHMIPTQRLKQWGIRTEDQRPIALLTPIAASTNRQIGGLNSADTIRGLKKDARPIMESHRVDHLLLAKAYESKKDLEEFVNDREKRLRSFIIDALGM